MFCFASLDGAREWNRSHPSRAFGAVSRRAKIPSPQPPSFLPTCWKPPAIFLDGGTERYGKVALAPRARATKRSSLLFGQVF